ncbi:MAG: phosphotransferase [Thermosulfidibacteraceae bacterium]|jgi:aminoglycoside phosphotransferase family enzyme
MDNIEILRKIIKPDEEIHTHISVVFIKGNFVYKIKKPVNFGFVDFSTIEKRKFFSEEEIRLNRRLTEDVYLDIVEIKDENNNLIDYAVLMRKLPMENSLKKLISEGKVVKKHIKMAIDKIAEFHKNSETNKYIQNFGKIENFRINIDENFEQTEKYIDITIEKELFDEIKKLTEKAINKLGEKINERAKAGYVKNCHGDLHSEHIVYEGNRCHIIDCIEFNERFRYIDILCDIAFLLMDLDYLDRSDLSDMALKRYLNLMGESGVEDLVNLFKSYRAYVRGKVNSLMTDDPNIKDKVETINRAKKYFLLARNYLKELS